MGDLEIENWPQSIKIYISSTEIKINKNNKEWWMTSMTTISGVCKLGWAQWNQSMFEFKFDGTRLSSYSKNFNLANLIMRKVWWIQNYLGFIVSDLT